MRGGFSAVTTGAKPLGVMASLNRDAAGRKPFLVRNSGGLTPIQSGPRPATASLRLVLTNSGRSSPLAVGLRPPLAPAGTTLALGASHLSAVLPQTAGPIRFASGPGLSGTADLLPVRPGFAMNAGRDVAASLVRAPELAVSVGPAVRRLLEDRPVPAVALSSGSHAPLGARPVGLHLANGWNPVMPDGRTGLSPSALVASPFPSAFAGAATVRLNGPVLVSVPLACLLFQPPPAAPRIGVPRVAGRFRDGAAAIARGISLVLRSRDAGRAPYALACRAPFAVAAARIDAILLDGFMEDVKEGRLNKRDPQLREKMAWYLEEHPFTPAAYRLFTTLVEGSAGNTPRRKLDNLRSWAGTFRDGRYAPIVTYYAAYHSYRASAYRDALAFSDEYLGSYSANHDRVHLLKALCLVSQSRFPDALSALGRVGESPDSPLLPQASFLTAWVHLQEQNTAKAKPILQALMRDHPASEYAAKAKQILEGLERKDGP